MANCCSVPCSPSSFLPCYRVARARFARQKLLQTEAEAPPVPADNSYLQGGPILHASPPLPPPKVRRRLRSGAQPKPLPHGRGTHSPGACTCFFRKKEACAPRSAWGRVLARHPLLHQAAPPPTPRSARALPAVAAPSLGREQGSRRAEPALPVEGACTKPGCVGGKAGQPTRRNSLQPGDSRVRLGAAGAFHVPLGFRKPEMGHTQQGLLQRCNIAFFQHPCLLVPGMLKLNHRRASGPSPSAALRCSAEQLPGWGRWA